MNKIMSCSYGNLNVMTSTFALSNVVTDMEDTLTWCSNSVRHLRCKVVYTSNYFSNLPHAGVLGFLSNTSVWASNTAATTSNYVTLVGRVAIWASNAANYGVMLGSWSSNNFSNVTGALAYSSNAARWASNTADSAKKDAVWASNTSLYASNIASWASNQSQLSAGTAMWASNTAMYASNTGTEALETATFASNMSVIANAAATWSSNNLWYVQNVACYASNTASYSSNVGTWASNNIDHLIHSVAMSYNTAMWANKYSRWALCKARWASNTASWASNTAWWASNTAWWASNTANWASNTASWSSNTTSWSSNMLSNLRYIDDTIPPLNGDARKGNFIVTNKGLDQCVYFIDFDGRVELLEDGGKLNFASNTARWSSNTADWASNKAFFASNTSVWASNTAFFGSNTAVWASNTARWGSNTADWASNKAFFASNTAVWASNTAVWGSNTADWASNTADLALDTAVWGSNTAHWGSNTSVWASNKAFFASNTSVWASNTAWTALNVANFASNTSVWGSNTADWASNNIPRLTHWVYPATTHTYTMCNVGIKTNNPQYPLDVNGAAAIRGELYVNPVNGGKVFVKNTTTNPDGIPTYGMGYSGGNLGLSGAEIKLYSQSAGNKLMLQTVSASNSSFAYPLGNVNEGGNPVSWSSIDAAGIEGKITDAIMPTVVVECNMRIPGNCAVNTVNAWSYCGEIALIKKMRNIDLTASNAVLGVVKSDNYQTTSGMAFTSDKRLKENVMAADLDICYSNVQNLELKYFKWKDQVTVDSTNDRHNLGWLAQEVAEVFPKSIKPTKAHGMKDCKSLNKEQIMASLYGAVQKLQRVQEEHTAVLAENVTLKKTVQEHAAVLAENVALKKTVQEHAQAVGELKGVCDNLNQRLNTLSIVFHTHMQSTLSSSS